MDDNQISQMIKSLEDEVANREMKTHITTGEKLDIYVVVTANRAGCLELARIFLKAAIEPIAEQECRSKAVVMPNPEIQVCSKQGDLLIAEIQRMEQWPEPETAIRQRRTDAWIRDRIGLFGCALVTCLLSFVGIGGVWFLWMVVTGKMR